MVTGATRYAQPGPIASPDRLLLRKVRFDIDASPLQPIRRRSINLDGQSDDPPPVARLGCQWRFDWWAGPVEPSIGSFQSDTTPIDNRRRAPCWRNDAACSDTVENACSLQRGSKWQFHTAKLGRIPGRHPRHRGPILKVHEQWACVLPKPGVIPLRASLLSGLAARSTRWMYDLERWRHW
jgi:hypothetical protein